MSAGWVEIRNRATGGTATVPQSALGIYEAAGWTREETPPPLPDAPEPVKPPGPDSAEPPDASAGVKTTTRRGSSGASSTDNTEETS